MKDRLQQLRDLKISSSDLRQRIENDSSFRKEIEELSMYFLGDKPHGCGNCYFDYFFKLRSKTIMDKSSNFELRAGVLLHDPVNRDISKILTRHNLTDELALYHLVHNPECRIYFSKLPENIDELIENQSRDDTAQPKKPKFAKRQKGKKVLHSNKNDL